MLVQVMTTAEYYSQENAHLRVLAQQQQHLDEYVAQVAQAELDHRCAGQVKS